MPNTSLAQRFNARLQRRFLHRAVARTRYENHSLRTLLQQWQAATTAIEQQIRTAGLYGATAARKDERRLGLGLVLPDRQRQAQALLTTVAGLLGTMSWQAMNVLRHDLPALIELEGREVPEEVNRHLQTQQEAQDEGPELPDDDPRIAALLEYIIKVAGGYRIISHRTGKNLGTFKTRAQAKKHLAHLAQFREFTEAEGDLPDPLLPPDVVPITPTFASVPTAQLTELLGTPLGGSHYATSFGDLATTLLIRLRNVLLMGLTQGQSVPQVTRLVRAVLRNARYQAERIVRTEYARVAAQAALVQFETNQELLHGVQWVATLDKRTCLQCAALDGKVWENAREAKVPTVDTHPNCRCVLVPIVKELPGLTLPPKQRASAEGPVPDTQTYEAWFTDQSPLLQREILGPTRYRLWYSGKLALPDFVSARGVRSVRDVLRSLQTPA